MSQRWYNSESAHSDNQPSEKNYDRLPDISSSNKDNNSVDNEGTHPFSQENSTKTQVHPFESSSPLIKCHTYIDLNDVVSPSWEIHGWPSKWKRLELLNRGIYNGAWANQELKRGEDNWYLCRNISCQLGLSERLKGRLWNIFQSLDMRSFKKYEVSSNLEYSIRWEKWDVEHPVIPSSPGGFRKQYLVIFCICALLHNQNKYEDQPGYYPGEECYERKRYGVRCRYVSNLVETELNDSHELLHQLADELGFRDKDIRSCMEKLRKACPSLEEDKP